MDKTTIYKRLYKDYSKKYLNKIIISAFFSILVAGSTSAIAWLLDPAIEKIFIQKDQSLLILIPLMIIFAFSKIIGILLFLSSLNILGQISDSTNSARFGFQKFINFLVKTI